MIDRLFRTKVDPPAEIFLSHNRETLLLGSCFSEHIGTKLQNYLFPVCKNPFGIIYNPASIANSLKRLREFALFQSEELAYNNGLYFSWMHHGSFSDISLQSSLDKINSVYKHAVVSYKSSKNLIITGGSSRTYQKITSGETVSNCHKFPQKEFRMHMLEPQESYDLLKYEIQSYLKNDSSRRVILTVSPVRHLKDGLVENQLSKSSLIVAFRKLEKEFDGVLYFPAFEIVNDELRDYRFYTDDMIHISTAAIEYIWEKLLESAATPETHRLVAEIHGLLQALNHRPRFPGTESHRKFLRATEKRMDILKNSYPDLPWENLNNAVETHPDLDTTEL